MLSIFQCLTKFSSSLIKPPILTPVFLYSALYNWTFNLVHTLSPHSSHVGLHHLFALYHLCLCYPSNYIKSVLFSNLIALSFIIALPLLLLYGQETWIWYSGCQHPKVINALPNLFPAVHPQPSLPTLKCLVLLLPLFPALGSGHVLLVPVFLLPLRPDLEAVVISGPHRWVL